MQGMVRMGFGTAHNAATIGGPHAFVNANVGENLYAVAHLDGRFFMAHDKCLSLRRQPSGNTTFFHDD